MQRWGYGINSKFKMSTVILEEGSPWIFWLEDAVQTVCSWIPEWLGHDWFHMNVCDKLFHWCNKKKKSYDIFIGYDKAKTLFYERDKEHFDYEASL